MRNLILITSMALFFFSCQKIDPEIAGPEELSSLNYSEKIFTQPIKLDNQIITLANNSSSNYLTAYSANGEQVWKTPVDDYIIERQSFEDIAYIRLNSNPESNIFLNMIQYDESGESVKSVRFDNQGHYLNAFSDTIHQTDTIFYQTDTIALPFQSMFTVSDIIHLSDGTTAVMSYWAPNVIDTTFIQMSFYNESGTHMKEQYYILPETVDVYHVFISKTNRLILESVNLQEETKIYIISRVNQEVFVSPKLPIYGLISFFENSKGEFVFTSGTFNADLDYFGLVICIAEDGHYIWHNTYADNSAWIFMSTTEVADGYIFTGFDVNVRLIEDIDWRTTFDTKNVKAIVVKTDSRGQYKNQVGWTKMLQIMGSSVGALTLFNENISFFGGKYDESIHSTMMLKLDHNGDILN